MRAALLVAALAAASAMACTRSNAAPSVPSHIPVWAFDEYHHEGADASPAEVRQYLSFAEGGIGNEKAVRDCNGSGACVSVMYFDPNFIYDSTVCPYSMYTGFLSQAQENWFVHLPGYSDAAHRLSGSYVQHCKGSAIDVPVYAANFANPDVRRYWVRYLQDYGDDWGAYQMDDTSDSMLTQFYGPGGGMCKALGGNGYCTHTQEIASDADVVRLRRRFAAEFKHVNGAPMTFYYNGISFTKNSPLVPPLLGNGSRFAGAICEGCVVSANRFRPNLYDKVLTAMAQIDRIPGASFVELNTGNAPAGSDAQIAQRLVTTAIAWLGFADGHTIVWPNLEDATNNLASWPEDGIYPTAPLETMSNGANDLAVAPRVYRREFRACYVAGSPAGPCAAVVNASAAPVTLSANWFKAVYSRAIVPAGGDVLDGGSLGSRPARDGEVIEPGQALLLER